MIDFLISPGTVVICAAALQTVAYVFANQITLRLFLLAGTFMYLLYYYIAADDPLWPAIFGTFCIAMTSIFGLTRALLHRSTMIISAEHMPIYEMMEDIEPGPFRKLMKTARIITYDSRQPMTELGVVPDNVYYTLEGDVDVSKSNFHFAVSSFNFIGEISIIGGFAATATVHSRPGTRAVVWDRQMLLAQMQRDEKFRIAVEALFSKDMAIKLAHSAKVC